MSRPTTRVQLLAAVTVTVVAVGAGVLAGPTSPPPERTRAAASAGAAIAAPAPAVRAAAVLRSWDAARAEAWAAGDVRRLAALYTPGSLAALQDQEMLRAWLRRGLVVRDLRTQLLAVREVRRTDRTWVLRVTDRVWGGIADGRTVARPLPRDSASQTVVTLRRLRGRWLVESVSAVRS